MDVIIEQLMHSETRSVLLCTGGTRRARVLEGHPGWPMVANHVVLLDGVDQRTLHDMIYDDLKPNGDSDTFRRYLTDVAAKHQTRSFIVACTDLHPAVKRWSQGGLCTYQFVDPLLHIARNLSHYLDEHEPAGKALAAAPES